MPVFCSLSIVLTIKSEQKRCSFFIRAEGLIPRRLRRGCWLLLAKAIRTATSASRSVNSCSIKKWRYFRFILSVSSIMKALPVTKFLVLKPTAAALDDVIHTILRQQIIRITSNLRKKGNRRNVKSAKIYKRAAYRQRFLFIRYSLRALRSLRLIKNETAKHAVPAKGWRLISVQQRRRYRSICV